MTYEQAVARYLEIRDTLKGKSYEEQSALVHEALTLAREHDLVPPGYVRDQTVPARRV